jgi:hypothetical protein
MRLKFTEATKKEKNLRRVPPNKTFSLVTRHGRTTPDVKLAPSLPFETFRGTHLPFPTGAEKGVLKTP